MKRFENGSDMMKLIRVLATTRAAELRTSCRRCRVAEILSRREFYDSDYFRMTNKVPYTVSLQAVV